MNSLKVLSTSLLLLAIVPLAPQESQAGDKKLSIQGRLTDTAGAPRTGIQMLTFRLYASSTSAVSSALWTETLSLTLQDGSFNAALGNVSSLDSLPFNKPYYLGIQVIGDASELSPRQLVGASSYALGSLGTFNVQGNIVSSGTLQAVQGVLGTIAGDDAVAGAVGEYFSAYTASGVPATTSSMFRNIVSITLTPGDWDVSGNLETSNNNATVTNWYTGAVSLYSGNDYTDLREGSNMAYGYALAPTAITSVSIPAWRVSTNTTRTVYLKALAQYSAGTPVFYGRISARRVR